MPEKKRESEPLRILGSEILPSKLAVSTRQAAYLVGVSERTLQQYIAAKLLPSRKIGGRRLILVADLERFLRKDQPFSIKEKEFQERDVKPVQSQNPQEGC